jgi:hypothetical protein
LNDRKYYGNEPELMYLDYFLKKKRDPTTDKEIIFSDVKYNNVNIE